MENQDQSFVRLLKKLSALRATLKNDERSLLDGLVTSSISEVSAHSMRVVPISPAKSTAKATSPDEAKANAMKVSTAKSAAKATSPDEAKANAMKVSTAKSAAKAASPDEAKANAMKVSTAKSAAKAASTDEVRANSMSYQIVFNKGKDEYQLKR